MAVNQAGIWVSGPAHVYAAFGTSGALYFGTTEETPG